MEYGELAGYCREILQQAPHELNLDPIGYFITELDANGSVAALAAPAEQEGNEGCL